MEAAALVLMIFILGFVAGMACEARHARIRQERLFQRWREMGILAK